MGRISILERPSLFNLVPFPPLLLTQTDEPPFILLSLVFSVYKYFFTETFLHITVAKKETNYFSQQFTFLTWLLRLYSVTIYFIVLLIPYLFGLVDKCSAYLNTTPLARQDVTPFLLLFSNVVHRIQSYSCYAVSWLGLCRLHLHQKLPRLAAVHTSTSSFNFLVN